ncbi:MAG: Stk1 family PASTA domain-containing Ser/Thr kinase [Erysipelotrichaceae bacterium]|nr:Stk1 family PASTA domain-containing Ser/Thr kinase [Erysipelotrichaceae bacterium]MBQ1521749.1 Stk1 family PASTA domain-containing Ser/Thr kinase [Erysipelotrichaceae bacterium]
MDGMVGNRYVIRRSIGEGGMADVYLAQDTILKREVAIKVLRGELNEDPVNLQRFQREANAITNLSHPNIVEVYDVGEADKKNYIVMEYVPGKTLKQLIKQRGALNPTEAINIMKQLVSATAHAHHNDIIHRDIKSQNVLIKDDGTVKLSDFGIASTGDSSQQLTQTDTVMGSVHYLAPELARGKAATAQSDIYSLGIVFFEMLTGDVPFHGDTAVQIALKHMHDEIPSVRAFNPNIPQSVENIVYRATAKEAEQRYSSADAMYDDLITCLDFSRSHEAKVTFHSTQKAAEKNTEIKPVARKVKKKKKNEDNNTLGTIGAVIASLAALILLLIVSGKISPPVKKVVVPDVINYEIEDAKTVLESYKLVIDNIVYEATEDVEKGHVIRISPKEGTEVTESEFVTLYVSSGKFYTVADYTGKSIDDIQPKLEGDGFTVRVSYVEDSTRSPGTITAQDVEAGTVLDPTQKRSITFTVASAVTIQIPDSLIGMTISDAEKYLTDKGIKVKTTQLPIEQNPIDPNTESYTYKTGVVVEVSPNTGTYYTQKEGTYIELRYY